MCGPALAPQPFVDYQLRYPCTLYHPKYAKLSRSRLLAECENVFKEMKIKADEADYLAEATQLQSESLVWFEHRRGRLTASRFLSICKTKVESPSKSLIDVVLQRTSPPKSQALRWGIEKEEVARRQYEQISSKKHTSFCVGTTGLHINPDHPHLGASPDGLVTCSCCGDGLLEIKCPYSLLHTTPHAISARGFLPSDHTWCLKALNTSPVQ